MEEDKARQMIVEIGRRMFDRRYVSANDGNISVRIDDNHILVTPAGVSKGYMTEDMMVLMSLDGEIISGTKPSSETAMHIRVYIENPEVNAVVHAHPITATAFAVCRIPLDLALMTESVLGLGVIPVAEYATTGTAKVADSIAPFCCDYNGVLLANHGAITWGENLTQAYYRMESLECCAMIMEKLGYLNRPAKLLTREQVQELVEKRQGLGVKSGGFPRCAEDMAYEKSEK